MNEFRAATLLEELDIEGNIVEHRRGELYRLAANRIRELELKLAPDMRTLGEICLGLPAYTIHPPLFPPMREGVPTPEYVPPPDKSVWAWLGPTPMREDCKRCGRLVVAPPISPETGK